jgi:hypothetical protein
VSRRGRSSISDDGRKVVPALGRDNSAAMRHAGVIERFQATTAAKAGLNAARCHLNLL